MAGTIIFDLPEGGLSGSQVLLPKPQSVSIKSNTQTYTSVSQNLSVETRSRGIQRWEVTLDFPPMNREDAMKVYSFIINQQGSFDTFKFIFPNSFNRDGTVDKRRSLSTTAGSQVTDKDQPPQVVDSRASVSRSIGVGNFNVGSAVLKAGDLFKFDSHDKIYMVTQDLDTTANNNGTGTLRFTPPLLQKGASGTDDGNTNDTFIGGDKIIFTDFEMSSSLLEDEFEFPIDENVFYKLSMRFGERVNVTNTA